MPSVLQSSGGFALSAADHVRLRKRLTTALGRARRHGEALASITVPVDPTVDPTAVVAASRRAGESWFCLEQPDRDGAALAALGTVIAIEDDGPHRFKRVAARWRALVARAACDPPEGLRGSGPIAVGGFAFAPDGGGAPHWAGYPAASLHVPEAAFVRRGGEVRLTLSALATPDDTVDDLLGRIERRAGELRIGAGLPLLDPDPAGRTRVVSAMPPEHYEQAVARGVERIRAGALEKVVLA